MTLTDDAIAFLRASDLLTVGLQDFADKSGAPAEKIRKMLAAAGNSWQRLLVDERQRRCADALARNPHIGLDELTDVCGYSQRSTMQATFEAWYDQPISEWRRERLG